MDKKEIDELLAKGETYNVEFKLTRNHVPESVYDSICAFSNKKGRCILLGVNDEKQVIGIDCVFIDQILKDLSTTLNNPNKIYPPFIFISRSNCLWR